VPMLDLPADPPAPEIPAFDVLQGASGTMAVGSGPAFLSQLLFIPPRSARPSVSPPPEKNTR